MANFFTSGPGRQPSMETDSTVYRVKANGSGTLGLSEVQRFRTVGAHGVVHLESLGEHYLAVPNYYGGDTVVLRWAPAGGRFVELQRLKSDGGGGVEAFSVGSRPMLAVAEFNVGVAALYVLQGDAARPEARRFEPWQRLPSPGCGALTTLRVPAGGGGEALLLLAASYVTRQTGWRTRSPVYALNAAATAFEKHSEVPTVGAHDVETHSVGGRHFAFYSNDKDERSTRQHSELFEWVGTFPRARLESRQQVATDGAHAAAFFAAAGGTAHYLAVANLGDRQANTYRRESVIYIFDPAATPMLTPLQLVPTKGATDFLGFDVGGTTFVAVSNEQDDVAGGDVSSTIWALKPPPTDDHSGDREEL